MFCGQCGTAIDDDSRFCRHCGAPQGAGPSPASISLVTNAAPQARPGDGRPATGGRGGKILALCIVILIVLIAIGSGKKTEPGPAVAGADEADVRAMENMSADLLASTDVPKSDADKPAVEPNWTYSTDEDKVRGGTTFFAATTSVNSIRQDPPYDADTTMRMTVRKHPAFGTDVVLTISSGQMMCPSYEGCSGTVRFDSGPAQRVSFNGPADNSSDTIFVIGARSFIAKLKKAKRVVIEKTLYNAGNPQFEFEIQGLNWPR